MKKVIKILKWTGLVLIVLILGFYIYVQVSWNKTFDREVPDLRATSDSAMIERGRYLAFGPAHCAECHAPGELINESVSSGMEFEGYPPLSGGFTYPLDIVTLHFPNITPDSQTGIGRYTDRQLVRLLRYGIKPNGQAMLPIMEYQNISDEDVIALLSFLRSQPPVKNEVPPSKYNFMGKAVKAFLIRPIGPEGTPPATSPPEEVSIARGEYLANRVAQCSQCHTTRNEMDFSLNAPRFSGGMELNEPWAPDVIFVPPNLTPDPETGHIVNWSEDQFVNRFRQGSLLEGSPMPWNAFGRMSDTDLRAIYMYLMSIEPVHNETGPLLRVKS